MAQGHLDVKIRSHIGISVETECMSGLHVIKLLKNNSERIKGHFTFSESSVVNKAPIKNT